MALAYTNMPNYVVGKVLAGTDKGFNVIFSKRLSSGVYQWPKKVLIEPVEKDQVVCFLHNIEVVKESVKVRNRTRTFTI